MLEKKYCICKQSIIVTLMLSCIISNMAWCSNKPILTLENDDPISALAFSSDGSKIIVGWKNSYIWDLTTGEQVLTIPSNAASCAAFSPDGSMAATGTNPLSNVFYYFTTEGVINENLLVSMWNANTYRKNNDFKTIVYDNGNIAFSPTSELLFVYDRYDESKTSYSGYVMCVSNQSIIQDCQFSGYLRLPHFSPDGDRLGVVVDRTIYLYDVSDLTSSVKEAEALRR